MVVDGEPSFTPTPTVLVDVKLDQDEGPRSEVDLPDFELCAELRRLMNRIDGIKNGKVVRLEIRGGVPRRVVFEPWLPESLRCHFFGTADETLVQSVTMTETKAPRVRS